MQDKIWEYALENALKFNGKPNPGAVIGKLMSQDPSIKSQMKEISAEIQQVIKQINQMNLDQIKTKLEQLNPEFDKQQQEKKQQRKADALKLPDLSNAKLGQVVTRIPPEPSKYAHIGHALSFLLNYSYAQQYKGKVILRFDDTNPEKCSQEYVDAMLQDIKEYLQIEPDQVIYASDYMDTFTEYAHTLFKDGKAYICTCAPEVMSTMRREGKPCEHRDQEYDPKHWESLLNGTGTGVVRLKIDMQHKNAVMRDPVIYRIVNATHYRTGDKYKLWPMYDFETAIMEAKLGITHVMRSNEFDSRIELQHYIAQLFGLPEVEFKHYGRFNIEGFTTKGREIREKIESGEFMGWDDPRLMTLKALKRRGVVQETLDILMRKAGTSKTPTNIDFTMVAAINRQVLDKQAKRCFFVAKPITIRADIPSAEVKLPWHPSDDMGYRTMTTTDEVVVEQEDWESIKEGEVFRFMDWCNVKKVGQSVAFESEAFDRKYKNIHWVCNGVEAQVLMPDTTKITGICEPSIQELDQDVIQFQRFGFCKHDHDNQFWFTHE